MASIVHHSGLRFSQVSTFEDAYDVTCVATDGPGGLYIEAVAEALSALARIVPHVSMALDGTFPAHDNTVHGFFNCRQYRFLQAVRSRIRLPNDGSAVRMDHWLPGLISTYDPEFNAEYDPLSFALLMPGVAHELCREINYRCRTMQQLEDYRGLFVLGERVNDELEDCLSRPLRFG